MLSTFGSPQLPRAGLAKPARATPGPVDTGVGAGAGPTVPGPGQHQPCSGSLETGLCPRPSAWSRGNVRRDHVQRCDRAARANVSAGAAYVICGVAVTLHSGTEKGGHAAERVTHGDVRKPVRRACRPSPAWRTCACTCVCVHVRVRAWGRWGKWQHSNLVILFQSL